MTIKRYVRRLTGFVFPGGFRDAFPLSGELIFDVIGLHVLDVDSADEHVIGNVVQMTAILQPWTSHRDMIGRAFAVNLKMEINMDRTFKCKLLHSLPRVTFSFSYFFPVSFSFFSCFFLFLSRGLATL